MKPETRHYLENLRADLTTVLIPELSSMKARTLAGMMSQLLEHLVARETALPDALAEHAASQARLLALLGDAPAGDDAALRLSAAADSLAARGDADAILRDLIDAEDRLDRANISSSDAGREGAYRVSSSQSSGERGGTRAELLTPERMTAYLRRRLPDHPGVVCTAVRPIPGGFSKDTTIVETEGAPGFGAMVIRQDQSVTSLGYTVVDEFPIIRTLYDAGLPLAEPLWLETDPSVLGNPFIVARKIDGTANMGAWAENDDDKRRIAGEIASFLARQHDFDPAKLPFDRATVSRGADALGTHLIDELYDIWQRKHLVPNPLMEFVFAWLRRNMPAEVTRPALVHADLGFHNVMVHQGHISAVLDWEFAHFGDPAEDLAYCQPFIEPVMPFEDFLAIYQAHGGGPYIAASGRFYRVLSTLRVSVGCYSLIHALETRAEGVDSKIAFIGTMYARRFLIDAAKHISAP